MKVVMFPLLLCAMAGSASAMTIASVDRNPAAVAPSSTDGPQAQFERTCLAQAGSRLVAAPGAAGGHRCLVADGRSFSPEDLDRAVKAKAAGH